MLTLETRTELETLLNRYRQGGYTVGFVPTMGALHEGHLSLARRAKAENAISVMSIFVNPKQFGPREDFTAYPRDLESDQAQAHRALVDFLYVPSEVDVYGEHATTEIEETHFSKELCGRFRPGHFRGVCTVVHRLFSIVRPDRAYFGMKDAQQYRVIQKMVEDLGLRIQVVGCPTIREDDGLAMSSRNRYLQKRERKKAVRLFAALDETRTRFEQGERSSNALLESCRSILSTEPDIAVQYLELRRWRDFEVTDRIEEPTLLAVAAFLGTTRLIDNVLLTP